jgi:signal transduction histidine kinase
MGFRPTRVLPWLTGLSARLLALTCAFVMLAEVLIFAPSIARFRDTYFEERINAAYLVSLALNVPTDNTVSAELARELLDSAQSFGIVLRRPHSRELVLSHPMPPEIADAYDLREHGLVMQAAEAAMAMARKGTRFIRVIGPAPHHPDILVETVIDEKPLRVAMFAYANRILLLSLIISLITGCLVYLSMQWVLVRPMRRITESMVAFRNDPENPTRIVVPGGRSDELGRAESALASMQEGLRAALRQRARLAELGAAMARINHDLRNILASAQLVSDTVSASNDPKVKRVAPTLLGAIDRAIALCSQTLTFAAGGSAPPVRRRFDLHDLVDEVFAEVGGVPTREVRWMNRVPPGLESVADRGQLFRVLTNLARNAAEAGAGAITIAARAAGGAVDIDVVDDGPGLSPRARDRLFQPFAGSTRPGGTGLGLAIARELVRGHGGDVALIESGAEGTIFRLSLPEAAEDLGLPRQAAAGE